MARYHPEKARKSYHTWVRSALSDWLHLSRGNYRLKGEAGRLQRVAFLLQTSFRFPLNKAAAALSSPLFWEAAAAHLVVIRLIPVAFKQLLHENLEDPNRVTARY